MIKTLSIFILLFASLPVSAQSADADHTWKSSDGRIIKAKFVRLESESVIIERNGKPFTIPFAKLAPESVQLAKTLKEGATGGTKAETETSPAAPDPIIRFRWLQTNPETADAITQILKANHLPADSFDAKIAPQIKSGEIVELATVERRIDNIRNFDVETPKHQELRSIHMYGEATGVAAGLLHLRCESSWYPNYPQVHGSISCMSGSLLSGKYWSIYARWGDAKVHTLLLACGTASSAIARPKSDHAVKIAEALYGDGANIYFNVEWRELSAASFAELTEVPPNELEAAESRDGRVLRPASFKPENRADAATWLRARSRLLASFTSSSLSSQPGELDQFWGGESLETGREKGQEGANEAPPRQGVTLRWVPFVWDEDTRRWQHYLSEIRGLDPTIWKDYTRRLTERNAATQRETAVGPEEIQPTLPRPLSVEFEASYVPLNARSKSDETYFKFVGKPLLPEVPVIYGPRVAPQQGKPVVVLVFTPWYEVMQ